MKNYLKNFKNLFLLVAVATMTLTSCEKDNEIVQTEDPNTVSLESDLIAKVLQSTSTGNPCFEVLYPYSLSAYDSNNQVLSTATVNNDQEVQAFFASLSATDFVEFNFPLSVQDGSGLITVVNDNNEFSMAMDAGLLGCMFGPDFDVNVCDDMNDGVEMVYLNDFFSLPIDPSIETLSYYSSDADAQAQTNPVSPDVTVNAGTVYTIYVRKDDSSNGTFTITEVELTLVQC